MSEAIQPVAETTAVATATFPDLGALQAQSEYGSPQGLAQIGAVGFNFLPRLQLFTSNSEEVKEGLIGVAHYGIIRGQDPVKDLGKQVIIMPLLWRSKAMDMRSYDKPVAFHKHQSEEFKAIRARADREQNSGCMYGPEYLVWVPTEKCFATFFMGSKTARNTAPAVKALMPKPGGTPRAGVLDAQFIKNDEYSWHGPTIKLSDQIVEPPPAEEAQALAVEFLNPVDSVIPEKPQPAPPEAANADR